jgi:hypothetical protein
VEGDGEVVGPSGLTASEQIFIRRYAWYVGEDEPPRPRMRERIRTVLLETLTKSSSSSIASSPDTAPFVQSHFLGASADTLPVALVPLVSFLERSVFFAALPLGIEAFEREATLHFRLDACVQAMEEHAGNALGGGSSEEEGVEGVEGGGGAAAGAGSGGGARGREGRDEALGRVMDTMDVPTDVILEVGGGAGGGGRAEGKRRSWREFLRRFGRRRRKDERAQMSKVPVVEGAELDVESVVRVLGASVRDVEERRAGHWWDRSGARRQVARACRRATRIAEHHFKEHVRDVASHLIASGRADLAALAGDDREVHGRAHGSVAHALRLLDPATMTPVAPADHRTPSMALGGTAGGAGGGSGGGQPSQAAPASISRKASMAIQSLLLRPSVSGSSSASASSASGSPAAAPAAWVWGGPAGSAQQQHPWSQFGVRVLFVPGACGGGAGPGPLRLQVTSHLRQVTERRPLRPPEPLAALNAWQHRKCAGCACGITTGRGWGLSGVRGDLQAHYCHYSELLFCGPCFLKGAREPLRRPIPWRMLHLGEFRTALEVAADVASFLDSVWWIPAVRPELDAPQVWAGPLPEADKLREAQELRRACIARIHRVAVEEGDAEGEEVRALAERAVQTDPHDMLVAPAAPPPPPPPAAAEDGAAGGCYWFRDSSFDVWAPGDLEGLASGQVIERMKRGVAVIFAADDE